VLTGRGRPVIDVDKNTKEITGSWQGGLEVTQVYIPGLREGSRPRLPPPRFDL
jgi:hypothetical protein